MNSKGRARGQQHQYGLDGKVVVERKVKAPPKARTCYICGRNYLLSSFAIHEPQCRKLFEDREMLKPPKERLKVPEDPVKTMMRGFDSEQRFAGGLNLQGNREQLDLINKASQEAYDGNLDKCRNCGRTFIAGKLEKHNKLCTAKNPAKPVGARPGRAPQMQSRMRSKNGSFSVKVGIGVKFEEPRPVPEGAQRDSAPDWKAKSESFRSLIRRAKMVTKAETQAREAKEMGLSGRVEDYLPAGFSEQGVADYARSTSDYVGRGRHAPAYNKTQAKASRLIKGSSSSGLRSSTAPGSSISYPDMKRQTARPTQTVDKGIVVQGPDTQAALLRARIAKQKAPVQPLLGRRRSGAGYASGSADADKDRERRMRKVLPGDAFQAPSVEAANRAVAMTTTHSMAIYSGEDLRRLIQAKHMGQKKPVKRF